MWSGSMATLWLVLLLGEFSLWKIAVGMMRVFLLSLDIWLVTVLGIVVRVGFRMDRETRLSRWL